MTTQDSGIITRSPRTIELEFGQFTKFANISGWINNGRFDYDRIAAELALSERQARRVLDAESRPSTAFIGGLLAVNEFAGFRRLFRVVNAADPIGRE